MLIIHVSFNFEVREVTEYTILDSRYYTHFYFKKSCECVPRRSFYVRWCTLEPKLILSLFFGGEGCEKLVWKGKVWVNALRMQVHTVKRVVMHYKSNLYQRPSDTWDGAWWWEQIASFGSPPVMWPQIQHEYETIWSFENARCPTSTMGGRSIIFLYRTPVAAKLWAFTK